MKKLKVFSISAIFIAICCSLFFSASVFAASKYRDKFNRKPSGNIYYYDENGHTVKGFVTIRGKKYYFNEKGIQQNGWQKIKTDKNRKITKKSTNPIAICYKIGTS